MTMHEIIDKNSLELLEICARYGWLKMPHIRDAMIDYANENGKTEAVAWLLDFKNRTADPAAERAKAEKKMLRELNADPNSVTELKKIWKYEKRADGIMAVIPRPENAEYYCKKSGIPYRFDEEEK